MKKILLISLGIALSTLTSFAFDKDNKANVLLIGDSISMGYQPSVTGNLKDIANVVRIKGNGQATKNALEVGSTKGKNKGNAPKDIKIKTYIGDKKWDVIHFNFGLHDLCYRHPESKNPGQRDKVNGTVGVTLEDYEANLQKIIDILKTTNAKLIFATTTYVPEGEAGRFPEDVQKYNEVAKKVMQKNNITINPLYELSVDVHKKHGKGDTNYVDKDGDEYKETEGNVHYDKEGSAILGKQVSDYIRQALIAPVCE